MSGKKIIVIGIVSTLLLGIALGVCFWSKKILIQSPQPIQPMAEPVDTAPHWLADIDMNVNNWKTYRNEEKKFGFKYPPQFKDAIFSDLTGTFGTERELYDVHILLGEHSYDSIRLIHSDVIASTDSLEGNVQLVRKRRSAQENIREQVVGDSVMLWSIDYKTKRGPGISGYMVNENRFMFFGTDILPTLTLEQTETVLVSILKTFEFID